MMPCVTTGGDPNVIINVGKNASTSFLDDVSDGVRYHLERSAAVRPAERNALVQVEVIIPLDTKFDGVNRI